MRLNLFIKAKYFLASKQVKITGTTNYSVSFEVGKYHVTGKYQNHQLYWLCDCKADTFQDICAHKIASQTYLTLHTPQGLDALNTEQKGEDCSQGQVINPTEIPLGLLHLSDTQKLALRQMVNFRCQNCKKHEDEIGKLETHRITRGADGGLYIPQNIKMLCKSCHDIYDY